MIWSDLEGLRFRSTALSLLRVLFFRRICGLLHCRTLLTFISTSTTSLPINPAQKKASSFFDRDCTSSFRNNCRTPVIHLNTAASEELSGRQGTSQKNVERSHGAENDGSGAVPAITEKADSDKIITFLVMMLANQNLCFLLLNLSRSASLRTFPKAVKRGCCHCSADTVSCIKIPKGGHEHEHDHN